MTDGKLFEGDWKESCDKTSFYYMRLRDSAKWTQGEGAKFTPSQPYDSLLHSMPFLWLLEMKSTKGASVSFFPKTPWERPKDSKREVMIKPNQVRELREAVTKQGAIGGFVINFRPRQLKSGETENKCYFVHIADFLKFVAESDKSSISEEDCAEIGVEIFCRHKKVRYEYNVVEFVNKAILVYLNRGYIDKAHLLKIKEWMEYILKE